jgi:hypothetical protein
VHDYLGHALFMIRIRFVVVRIIVLTESHFDSIRLVTELKLRFKLVRKDRQKRAEINEDKKLLLQTMSSGQHKVGRHQRASAQVQLILIVQNCDLRSIQLT